MSKLSKKSLTFILCISSTFLKPSHSLGAKRIKKTDGGILNTNEALEIAKLGINDKQKKLLEMCHKIDTNQDSKLSPEELLIWTNSTVKKWLDISVKHQWDVYDNDNDGKVGWLEFKKLSYAELSEHLDEEDNFIQNKNDPSGEKKKPLIRDSAGILIEEVIDQDFLLKEVRKQKRRFKQADLNSDGMLDLDEFPPFVHPEEFKSMKRVLASETLEEMDTDKDGLINEKEWIHEIYEKDEVAKERKKNSLKENANSNSKDGNAEPEWLLQEIDHFYTVRDSDGDGKMDVEDVERWLNPEGYDPIKQDVEHLFWEIDEDKDRLLSYEEILKKYEVFTVSKSTMYGNELHTRHDEL